MLVSQPPVLDHDELPGLEMVVSDEAWERASVKDDAVKLDTRSGAGGREKLSYEMLWLGGDPRSASRSSSSGVPAMVWVGRVGTWVGWAGTGRSPTDKTKNTINTIVWASLLGKADGNPPVS